MTRALALVICAAVLHAGCSGPCKQVRREWAQVHETRPPAAEPHIRVQLPFAVANRLIAEAVGSDVVASIDARVLGRGAPMLAILAPRLASLRAEVRNVTVEPGPPGTVRFVARIGLSDSDGFLLGVRAITEVAPVVERGAITVAVRPDQLVRIEPELGPGPREFFTDALYRRLEQDGHHVPRMLVDRLAPELVEALVANGHALLRDNVLTRVGELTRLRFALPPIPIDRTELTSTEQALELAIHTSLPVRAGISAAPARDDAITVRVAGSAAAELANWSIAEGHAPQRYTRKLEPAADGPYVPHFDWHAGDARQPMHVHMFALRGKGCAHFLAVGRPQVSVEHGRVKANVTNRALAHSVGPPFLEMAAAVNDFFQRSTSKTRWAEAQVALTVGGRPVKAALVDATVLDEGVAAAFTLSIGPKE